MPVHEPDFDAYLMVDWSGRSEPSQGSDSIWYYLLVREEGTLVAEELENPRTRREAVSEIREVLSRMVARRLATLVGFDFPYSYPAGFASALELDRPKPWRAIWDELGRRIEDRSDNSNNRFSVAAQLNRRVSNGPSPFWGCTDRHACSTLSRTKPSATILPEFRLTDRWSTRQPQSVWKLAGVGSVGSQALLGIPYIARLRDDLELAPVSRAWPFETGLRALPSRTEREWLVLHAEIYPSLIGALPDLGEVKDSAQVRSLARYFAEADNTGRLSDLFAGPPSIGETDRRLVETEEGWILGVTDANSRFRFEPDTVMSTENPVRSAGVKAYQELPSEPSEQGRRRASQGTTEPGYENRNGQVVIRPTGLPGTDHCQSIYALRCGWCGHEYGANGSDIFLRRCPACQGGSPGLRY